MNTAGNGSGGGDLARGFLRIICAAAVIGGLVAPAWAVTVVPIGTLADSNGQMAAWGLNNYGQCNIPAGTYSAIAAGNQHSVALRTDGTLAAWGANDPGYGQCDNIPTGNDFSAIAGGYDHSLALRSDGTLAAWGRNYDGQCNVPGGNNYSAVAGGGWHSLALRSDGSVAAWGYNGYGECNVPAGTYSAVAGGDYHSVGLRADGTLAYWGDNYGLGPPPAGTYSAVAAGGYHSLALRADGTLAAWGLNNYGQCNVLAGTYSAMDGGEAHTLALRADGTLAAWGYDGYGQCSNVPAGIFVAVAAGGYHGLALEARTDYDGDLLVSGTGVYANLNRAITVAGDASIQSTMYLYNNPTMAVAGTTTITPTGAVLGEGTLSGIVINRGLVDGGGGGGGVTFSGPVSGDGDYAGHVTFNGGFSPGLSPASVSGDWFTFGPANTLTMELGGTVQGDEYDHITASDLLALAGTLDVVLIPPFTPDTGDTFDLFDGSMEGSFGAVNLPELGAGLSWDTSRLYTSGEISVAGAQNGDIPEPATLTLLALGGLTLLRRRRGRGRSGAC